MNRNAAYYLKTGSLILFVIIVLGYSFFQIRNVILGPEISLESPLDGQTYTHDLIEIKGTAKNVNYLTLNDKPIFTDTEGNFEQHALLFSGYNVIKLYAENKFGKKTEKIIQVIYKEDDTLVKKQVVNPTATSTISTTTNSN